MVSVILSVTYSRKPGWRQPLITGAPASELSDGPLIIPLALY